MPESLIETAHESAKRRVLHTALKGLAFVPNLIVAAIVGSLLAAPISLLLFYIFPSSIAAYAQDVTTLPACVRFGLLSRAQVPSFCRALDLGSGDCAVAAGRPTRRGQLYRPDLRPVPIAVLPARIRFRHPLQLR